MSEMTIHPCPFCEGTSIPQNHYFEGHDKNWVQCTKCKATGPVAESLMECIRLWHERSDRRYFDNPNQNKSALPNDRFTDYDKAAIVAQMNTDNISVQHMANRHGLYTATLYAWRKQFPEAR